jgi:hypothetical protein
MCLRAAVAEAECVLGFEDLPAGHCGIDLIMRLPGEIIDIVPAPIAVVSDNAGPPDAIGVRRCAGVGR